MGFRTTRNLSASRQWCAQDGFLQRLVLRKLEALSLAEASHRMPRPALCPDGQLGKSFGRPALAVSVSMAWLPQHLLASQVPYMTLCINQQQPRSTIFPGARAWKKATFVVPGNESVVLTNESMREETKDRISLEHLIDLRGHGSRPHSPSTVLVSLRHFAYTSLRPRCLASDSVMTVRTPNRSCCPNRVPVLV